MIGRTCSSVTGFREEVGHAVRAASLRRGTALHGSAARSSPQTPCPRPVPGRAGSSLEAYVKRLEKLEEIANSFQGVQQSYAIQAGREVRILVKPEQIDDTAARLMARDIAKRIESGSRASGQIRVTVVRETRAIGPAGQMISRESGTGRAPFLLPENLTRG